MVALHDVIESFLSCKSLNAHLDVDRVLIAFSSKQAHKTSIAIDKRIITNNQYPCSCYVRMIITVEEGTKLGTDFVSSICASAHKNNYAELMSHFFADKISWTSSDGSEGNGSPNFDILKNGWGMTSSYMTHMKPFVCVDTENGRIIVTFTMVANVNARREGVTNIIMNPITYILIVNEDKKVVRWDSVFDNNNANATKVFAKLGIDFPKAENSQMLITRAEGEAFATNYLQAISDGFLDNSHAEKCRNFVADHVSWDWSDGSKGSGTREEMHGILSKSWGRMLSSWIPVDPIVIVDTANRVLTISFHLVCNVTGGLRDESNLVHVPEVFVLQLDDSNKVRKLTAHWDNNDCALQAVVQKIKAKLEMAQTTVGKVLNVSSDMEGIMTGQ